MTEKHIRPGGVVNQLEPAWNSGYDTRELLPSVRRKATGAARWATRWAGQTGDQAQMKSEWNGRFLPKYA